MVLFVSDTHFGLGSAPRERSIESALVQCLASYEERVTHLFLVGDIFDGYIEYRHLVPKGFVRFMALLSAWTDRGIEITYLIGNHDPWHRNYFSTELGVRVVSGPLLEDAAGAMCYVRHGDGLSRSERLLRSIKPLLRNSVLVWLYRNCLPADAGLALAQAVSRQLQKRQPNPHTAAGMRRFARETLTATAAQVLIMGHSHKAELCKWPEGVYMNLGSWRDDGAFGLLEGEHARLFRWCDNKAELVDEHRFQ